ncbi:MAG: DNA translocase FtsK [Proteobacteria bacterium]|nr:DNA translocase FtsK [Pseudomonadota bacterium]
MQKKAIQNKQGRNKASGRTPQTAKKQASEAKSEAKKVTPNRQPKAALAKTPKISPNRRLSKRPRNYIAASMLIILGAALFLMLFTFSKDDLLPDSQTAYNIFGIVGAHIANLLLMLFGLSSFFFPTVCLLMGLTIFCGRQLEVKPSELIGLIFLLLAGSPIFTLSFEQSSILDHSPGGVLGTWLSGFALTYISQPMLYAIGSVLLVFGVLLATDTRFIDFVKSIFRAIRWTVLILIKIFAILIKAFAAPFRHSPDERPLAQAAPILIDPPTGYDDLESCEDAFEDETPSQILCGLLPNETRDAAYSSELPSSDDDIHAILPYETAGAKEAAPGNGIPDESLHPSMSESFDSAQDQDDSPKTEGVAGILAIARGKNTPRLRAAKRKHSVPALEPDFEFDSILHPQQIAGQISRNASDGTEKIKQAPGVLPNWKPRSILRKGQASQNDRETCDQRFTQDFCSESDEFNETDSIQTGRNLDRPPNVTRDILAQCEESMASHKFSLPVSVQNIALAPNAITRVANLSPQQRQEAVPTPVARMAAADTIAPLSDVLQKERGLASEKKTAVPVSSELRSLMAEMKADTLPSKEPASGQRPPQATLLADLDIKPVSRRHAETAVSPDTPLLPSSASAKNTIDHSDAFVVAQAKQRASEDELNEADKARRQKLREKAYEFPPLSLLHYNPASEQGYNHDALRALADRIEEKFAEFKIEGSVMQICPGPVITRFEYQPAAGTKISKIASLSDDLMMALEIKSIRILAPIPGKNVVGIEIPNEKRNTIFLKEIIASEAFVKSKSKLTIALGHDSEGTSVVSNLAKMPHLLVAGSTGSGKSVGINTMLCSLLYNATPEEVKLILVDPKCLEFSIYRGIPHLLVPPITGVKEASAALDWACEEMDRRYQLLADLNVRNIDGYNERIKTPPDNRIREALKQTNENGEPLHQFMPYIVIVVDEFADLIMQAGKEIEISIARLAQKARACGIHIILATQRPSTNVITGVIKANFPTRLAFRVFSQIDSRTILDQKGAEALLGMGDSLFLPPNSGILERVHGAFVSDEEVQAIVDFLCEQGQPQYNLDIITPKENADDIDSACDDYKDDNIYDKAVRLIAETQQASTSYLQRRLNLGYNRAAKLIDQLEADGIIGPANGSKPREVYINRI